MNAAGLKPKEVFRRGLYGGGSDPRDIAITTAFRDALAGVGLALPAPEPRTPEPVPPRRERADKRPPRAPRPAWTASAVLERKRAAARGD
jgi:hypothetical protein